MGSLALPTTLTITGSTQPKFAECSMPIISGYAINIGPDGRMRHASNTDVLYARVDGIAIGSTHVAGQWNAYAPPDVDLTVSGLTATVTYYLEHGTDQVQTVTVTGVPTGGTYTLTWGGLTTAAIAFNAIASVVQTAVDAIFGANNSLVAGSGPYTITFKKSLGARTNALATLSNNLLTGGTSPSVTITETTAAVSGGRTCLVADLNTNDVITVLGVAKSATLLAFDVINTATLK
jgi:hypothetical protein